MEQLNKIIGLVKEIEAEEDCPVRYSQFIKSSEILKAESMLGGKFPEDYSQFIKKYGFLSLVGEEFYGLISNKVPGKAIPCIIWITLELRKDSELYNNFAVIHTDGSGSYHAIPLEIGESGYENACPVYKMSIEYDGLKRELISSDFTDFFCSKVESAWEYW